MATRNIQMNYFNGSSYDVLHPEISAANINGGLSANQISYNNASTSSIITSNQVQGAIDNLFTSVSNGKNLIAGAITGMGGSASGSNSWQELSNEIRGLNVLFENKDFYGEYPDNYNYIVGEEMDNTSLNQYILVPNNQETMILSASPGGSNPTILIMYIYGYVFQRNYGDFNNPFFSFIKILTNLSNEIKYTSLGNGSLGFRAILNEFNDIQLFVSINNVWEGNTYYFKNIFLRTVYFNTSNT